jgi:Chlorophyll A-B binding protein
MFVLEKNPNDFARFREQEIKHGRVAMLAVTGYLTTAAGVRFPGAEAVPAGFKAFSTLYNNEVEGGLNVLMQFMFTTLLMEIVNGDRTGKGEFPGDYRNGAFDFGWNKQTDEWKTKKRSIELNQGRAAMMGISGLMIHEWMGVSILPGGYLP